MRANAWLTVPFLYRPAEGKGFSMASEHGSVTVEGASDGRTRDGGEGYVVTAGPWRRTEDGEKDGRSRAVLSGAASSFGGRLYVFNNDQTRPGSLED